jgi:hypothetical protein
VQRDRELEEWLPGQIPFGLQLGDEPFQRHISMCKALQHDAPDPAQQLHEAGIAGQIRTQNHRRHETADHRLDIAVPASCICRAHKEILLPGPSRQNDLVRRQQHHERSGLLAPGETRELFGEISR